MKSCAQALFLIVSVLYAATAAFQIVQLLSPFQFKLTSSGFGLAYQVPDHMAGILVVLALNFVAFLISVYIGMVGIRLVKGDIRGLKKASFLAFLLPPLGLIAGLLGLSYLRAFKRDHDCATR